MDVFNPTFRTDLKIRAVHKPGLQAPVYVILDPVNNEQFELNAQDHFLCSCMDGKSTLDEIAAKYKEKFEQDLSAGYFTKLLNQLKGMNLMQSVPEQKSAASAGIESSGSWLQDEEDVEIDTVKGQKRYAFFPWCDPGPFFENVVQTFRPLHMFLRILTYLLLLSVPPALSFLYQKRDLLYADLAKDHLGFDFIARLIAIIAAVDLLRCFITGSVATYFGSRVTEFGLRLRFGIFPRLYVKRTGSGQLSPSDRLWVYGSSLLIRFILIVAGTLLWFLFRLSSPVLSGWGIFMLHAGIIGFILMALPYRISDGYRWLTTYFNLPPNLLQQAMFALRCVVTRKTLPTPIRNNRKKLFRLLAYAIVLMILWPLLGLHILFGISTSISGAFPEIFGRATDMIVFALVLFLVSRWILAKVNKNHAGPVAASVSTEPAASGFLSFAKWFVLTLGVMCIPLGFRPGGTIELRQSDELTITAPLTGRISNVFYEGGDGQILEEGTVVARIISDELEFELDKTSENIIRQTAEIEKHIANVMKLQAGSRKEEIARAKAATERESEEVEMATDWLHAAEVSLTYSLRRVELLQSLYEDGVIPELDFDEERRRVDLDGIAVKTAKHQLNARAASLREAQAYYEMIQAGTREEVLQEARAELAAAESSKRNLEQQLDYLETTLKKNELVMPLTGYLTEGFLHQSVGRQITKGDSFAKVQSEEDIILMMNVPEYDGIYIQEGQEAYIRLHAFPVSSVQGHVTRVEPVPSIQQGYRVFQVEIQVDRGNLPWKPGITGYAKVHVGWKPLGLILLRPLVRFFQVEIWSWFP